MKNGFIKLHRRMLENPLCTKPNYLSIWIYLLLYANHKDTEIIWNNKKILIKRGSFVGSLRKISEYFGISISTVKYIVDYLVSEQMIEHRPTKKFSLFIIKNYDKYQNLNTELHTNETQIKTTNNDKNEKKIYKDGKKIKLHDGTYALMRFGQWVDPANPLVKIDPRYYPEITKL